MNTYIVTGATSFIGLSVCRILLEESNIVYAICRKNSVNLSKLLLHKNLKIIYSNFEEIDSIISQIPKADVFINLAWAGTKHLERNNVDIHSENVNNTLNAIKVAHKIGCKLFVEAGSQAEYGFIPEHIKETSICKPETEYGKAKLKIRILGEQISLELGMKYLHLRIFSVFGENDHPWTMMMSVLNKMINNEVINLSSCTQSWNYLYVEDAAKQINLLCRYALANDDYVAEVFHVASEDTRLLKSFIQEMYYLTMSTSVLNFGNVIPQNNVSLKPSMEKTKAAIGFVSEYSFSTAVLRVINSLK